MNCINKKLRSEKGASITFALLIFLVCAVVSSVILVAATTASGRVSEEAASDQRYYSVTSAVGLLKELIDGSAVTVKEVVTEGSDTTETYIGVDSDNDGVIEYTAIPDTDAHTFDSIQKDAAYQSYAYSKSPSGSAMDENHLSVALTADDSIDPKDEAVTVDEELNKATGDITLTLYNTYDSKGNNSDVGSQYKVAMVFKADMQKTTETRNTQKTNYYTFEWDLTNVVVL